MEWIKFIINALIIFLSSGGCYYFINRKLKKMEILEKEIEVVKKQDDEWQELYQTEKSKVDELEDAVKELREKNEKLVKANGLLELKNLQLTWYRCTVNNCPNRRPPHVFDKDGNELEVCS